MNLQPWPFAAAGLLESDWPHGSHYAGNNRVGRKFDFWSLTPGGVIARSTDGHSLAPLSSGTTSDLFAGAAPSAEICWVVGRRGTVLRTIDGER
jgi:hypothetical protein